MTQTREKVAVVLGRAVTQMKRSSLRSTRHLSLRFLVAVFLAVSALRANAQTGTIYFVLGSDADTWNYGITPGNYGTTVNVFVPHPVYPQGLFTDPNGPGFAVMDPAFRTNWVDSFGHGLKFTWWMMGGNIFREAVNANVPLPSTMNVYLMKKYHGAAIDQFGDELTLHYHTFIWNDYDGDGVSYWNQSKTFNECREDFEQTVAEYLLEENVFAASFRSGWHYMDNDWQARLNELLPFSLHNNWPASRAWFLPEPVNNVEDWSQATSFFVPFHPAITNYEVAGDSPGWNVRSEKMQYLNQTSLDQIFQIAANGTNQVVCYWDHLPENFVANVNRLCALIATAASNSPNVNFRFCTAVEAMQRWLGVWNQPAVTLQVNDTGASSGVTLAISTSGPIFQPQPYVAMKDIYGQISILPCTNTGPNSWSVSLPIPRDSVAKVGVAVTDPAGNVAKQILRFLPDDLYLETADPSYAELAGDWSSVTNSAWGTNARVAPITMENPASAQWTLPLTWSGRYEIYAQVPPLTNAADHVSVDVLAGNSTNLSVDATLPWPSQQWIYLGATTLNVSNNNVARFIYNTTNLSGATAAANVIKLSPLLRGQIGFISNVAVEPFDTTANITWSTLAPSTTLAEFGATPSYGNYTETNFTQVVQHVATLTGLKAGATNYFQLDSTDNGVLYSYQGSFVTSDFSSVFVNFDLTNAWRYSASNLDGVSWTSPAFDDSAWPSGPGLLWVDTRATGPNPAVLNRHTQMPADPATGLPYITYYFRTHFSVAKPSVVSALVFSNYIDDGAIFYLNGVEIHRNNMPAAPAVVTNSSLASAFNCDGDATCPVLFTASGDLLTNLVSGDNVLAVEVHNFSADSPDITFGSALLEHASFPPPATLHLLFTDPTLTLYWNGAGYGLDRAAGFRSGAGDWTTWTEAVVRSPYMVTNSGTGAQYFRLRQ